MRGECSVVNSVIKEIGEFAYFEDEPIIILFNTTAPEGLKEVCVMHEYHETPTADLLRKGSRILFGKQEYHVDDIGHLANSSLLELGHASLYFDLAPDQELLPGSIAVSPNKIPKLAEGDAIQFIY